MNKKWIIVFLTVFITALVIVIFQSTIKEKKVYEDIDLVEYQEKLEKKEDFIIYVYSPNCLACKEFAPTLNSEIKKMILSYSLWTFQKKITWIKHSLKKIR